MRFLLKGLLSPVKFRNIQCETKRLLGEALALPNQIPAQKKRIGYWMFGCAGLVFGAVTIGGLTRLTESGLSMVKWDVFKTMPPLNAQDWQREFELYKQYPDYKFKVGHEEMSMGTFKFIWLMEYIHRMGGRAIGLAFFIPCVYFWARGRFSKNMKIRMALAGTLILGQGALGWYMVKSGLDPSHNSNAEIPRVSQYRLASHLSMAFILYSIFLWTGLSYTVKPYDHSVVSNISRLRAWTHGTKAVIFITVITGAFVAGLDAGFVYNSWPKYGEYWIPETLWTRRPLWRNFFENEVTAYITLFSVTGTWLVGRRMKLSPRAKVALYALLGMGYSQAVIGISTLIHFIPIWLASLHQNSAVALFSLALWFSHEIRRIPK